jgi:DNA-binding XRE family transcriptional regulator
MTLITKLRQADVARVLGVTETTYYVGDRSTEG